MFQIGINNFRVLNDIENINFKNVNILTGTNNSGKSTLVKLLLLLQDAFRHSDFPELFFVTAKYNLGDFESNLTKKSDNKFITIKFKPDDNSKLLEFDFYFQYRFAKNIGDNEKALFYDLMLYLFGQEQPFIIIANNNSYDYKNYESFYDDNNKEKENLFSNSNLEDIKDEKYPFSFHIHKHQLFVLYTVLENNYKELNEVLEHYQALLKDEQSKKEKLREEISELENKINTDLDDNSIKDIDKEIKNKSAEIEMLKTEIVDLQNIVVGNSNKDKFNIDNDYLHYVIEAKPRRIKNIISDFKDFNNFNYEINNKLHIYSNYVKFLDIETDESNIANWFGDIQHDIEKTLSYFVKHQFYYVSSVLDLNARFISDNHANLFLKDYYVKKDKKAIEDKINEWLKFFEIGNSIEIERIKNSGFAIRIKDNDKIVNITDWGDGTKHLVSLILQIIILSGLDRNKAEIFLIEEPEVHLHPKIQSKLAEFFVQIAEKLNIKLIIETHSEYLIRKLQIMVAEEKANNDDISIYYFDKEMKKIDINATGILSADFGNGFFDEGATLITGLWKIQRK